MWHGFRVSTERVMDRYCRGVGLGILLLLCVGGGLAGCADAITVHPVVAHDDPVPDVPSVSGQWRVSEPGSTAFLELQGGPEAKGQCRDGTLRLQLDADPPSEVGDRLCFTEFNGNLVAEVHSVEPMADFYRQFLVRVEKDRFEVCGRFPLWAMLWELRETRPTGYSFDALEWTKRESHFETLFVVISQPSTMRELLEVALPELAAACDARLDSDFRWFAFDRMKPEEIEEREAAMTGPAPAE